MRLLSINVGRPRLAQRNGTTVSTAIFKRPVDGPVQLGVLGLEGDDQADKSCHGGVDKAVYAYSGDNYAWWREQLAGRDLSPGEFGENLTVEGMTDDRVAIGDVFRIGMASVQVTQPRTPCMKLGVKMNDPTFVKRFHQAARTGFYLRVLEEGVVTAGDEIELERQSDERRTIAEIYQLKFSRGAARDDYHRAAVLEGLSEAWRCDFLKLVEAC